jgi:hypothetical protein
MGSNNSTIHRTTPSLQPRRTKADLAERYRKQNVEAAKVITENSDKYGGALVEWAYMVLTGEKADRPTWRLAA